MDALILEIHLIYENHGKFWVECLVDSYGRDSLHTIMCDSMEEAKSYQINDTIVI